MRKRLQNHISGLYIIAPRDEDKKEKYENEAVNPLKSKYSHILYDQETNQLRFKIMQFYRGVVKLDNLLREKGHYKELVSGF